MWDVLVPGSHTVKMTSATCGELLMFSGIGVAMVVFVLTAKLMYRLEEDKMVTRTRRKCSQVIDFCRQMGVWCAGYQVTSVFLLIATVLNERGSPYYVVLLNFSFSGIVLISIIMLYLYFKYNVLSHLEDLVWSLRNLEDR